MRMLKMLGVALIAGLALVSLASAQKWQNLNHPPTFKRTLLYSLTDGERMVHEYNTPNWWALSLTILAATSMEHGRSWPRCRRLMRRCTSLRRF